MRPQTERSDFLDGLRGFALFGILIVNLGWFKAPLWARPSYDHLIHDAPLHRTTEILLQSIIGTTLFYGYGFGLYGQLGIAWIPVLAVAIFTFQMILSRYWLTRFRYGPAEWLWRNLTYRGEV